MSKATKVPSAPEIISKKAAAQKIMAVAGEIHEDIVKKHRKPEMVFPIRSLQNVRFDVKRGHFEILGKTATRTLSYNTVKTFAQSMRLLATTKNDLLDKDDIAAWDLWMEAARVHATTHAFRRHVDSSRRLLATR